MLPSADTAAMLFWALLASSQINMRKVDGWQTLVPNPSITQLTSPLDQIASMPRGDCVTQIPTAFRTAPKQTLEIHYAPFVSSASCLSALWLTGFAVAETACRPDPPKISETQDPEKKAEYLESIPYKPCPASVVLPNGRHACIGMPGNPELNSLHDRRDPATDLVH